MATTRGATTDADLMHVPRDGRKYELVNGDIVVSPAGMRHGRVIVKLTARLDAHVEAKHLGMVFDSSTGFRLPRGNVRSPDVSFVTTARLPKGEIPQGFGELAPDLVVEVLSPGDDEPALFEKLGEYLGAGVRLIWVIDPTRRSATAYRSLVQTRHLAADDFLDGEDIVPGFRCSLSEVLG